MIRVLLVDDHAVVRAGLGELLGDADEIEVAAAAADGAEGVMLARECQPDGVLMDLSMPVLDGIDATRQIMAESGGARVVVLTSFSDEPRNLQALDAGAVGYLLKDAEPDELARRESCSNSSLPAGSADTFTVSPLAGAVSVAGLVEALVSESLPPHPTTASAIDPITSAVASPLIIDAPHALVDDRERVPPVGSRFQVDLGPTTPGKREPRPAAGKEGREPGPPVASRATAAEARTFGGR